MPTTYHPADAEVCELLAAATTRWHPELAAAGVRVAVLMAENPDGDPVKHGGYPALATVRVVSLKDRVLKLVDAEMPIDGGEWGTLTDRHRVAVLDHELRHLKLVPAEDDRRPGDPPWQVDDLGRPKLRIRPGDWNAGDGFACAVERHGSFAAEFLNLDRCYARAVAARDRGESEADPRD